MHWGGGQIFDGSPCFPQGALVGMCNTILPLCKPRQGLCRHVKWCQVGAISNFFRVSIPEEGRAFVAIWPRFGPLLILSLR